MNNNETEYTTGSDCPNTLTIATAYYMAETSDMVFPISGDEMIRNHDR